MAKKDLMDIGNIQQQIDQASEVQSASSLLDEVKKAALQLAAILDAITKLKNKTDDLEQSYDGQIDKMQTASTVTFPSETIEFIIKVFNSFISMFGKMLDEKTDAKSKDICKAFKPIENKLEEHRKMLEKCNDRIPLPYPFFNAVFYLLACLFCFFAIVVSFNIYYIHSEQLTTISWAFGGLMVAGISLIIYLARRDKDERRY